MGTALKRHSYEVIFDERNLARKIAFEAIDRSAIFSDHNRVNGTFEIREDGLRIARASYSSTGRFWVLSR